ncbi:MAG: CBS domain-containing protein [Lapillicoccus sp.]
MLVCDLDVLRARGVRPSGTPEHALDLMAINGFSTLPVIDANGELVGVITEQNARRLVDGSGEVSLAMSQPPALGIHDGLSVALRILDGSAWDALPVTDDRRLVGLLSRQSAMAAKVSNADLLSRDLRAVQALGS